MNELNLGNPIVRKVLFKHAILMGGIVAAFTVVQDLVKLAILAEDDK